MKHLVITCPGGPLAAMIGIRDISPEVFLNEVAGCIRSSEAQTVEFVCVDPNTNAPYTDDLDKHEAGFVQPDFEGNGWNAKIYDSGGNRASFHKYCGCDSTNFNNGQWREHTDRKKDVLQALEAGLKKRGISLDFIEYEYHKQPREGRVPEDLVKKVKSEFV